MQVITRHIEVYAVMPSLKSMKLGSGKLSKVLPSGPGLAPLDNSSGSALRGICSGDELLNTAL